MSVIWLDDLREGDIIEIKDPIYLTRLARVAKITPRGELVVCRRWRVPVGLTAKWGPPLHIELSIVIRRVERV